MGKVVSIVGMPRRSKSYPPIAAANRRKTHCPAGHPYDGGNLYVTPTGRRGCRTCRRAQFAAYRKRRCGDEDDDMDAHTMHFALEVAAFVVFVIAASGWPVLQSSPVWPRLLAVGAALVVLAMLVGCDRTPAEKPVETTSTTRVPG